MLIDNAEAELLRRLRAARLDPEALDPWEAWKVFKSFLAVPLLEDAYDAASFQCGMDTAVEDPEAFAIFARQFSRRHGKTDELVGRVVVELRYDPLQVPWKGSTELWSHDFPTLGEFTAVVEGLSEFQGVVNLQPRDSEVYSDD